MNPIVFHSLIMHVSNYIEYTFPHLWQSCQDIINKKYAIRVFEGWFKKFKRIDIFPTVLEESQVTVEAQFDLGRKFSNNLLLCIIHETSTRFRYLKLIATKNKRQLLLAEFLALLPLSLLAARFNNERQRSSRWLNFISLGKKKLYLRRTLVWGNNQIFVECQ